MEVLTDKSIKTYDYTSRYAPFPFYFNNEDNKYVYGLTSQLSLNTEYTIHMVKDTDTLDYLAYYYYGRPDLFWVIADFNRIQDPYIKLSDKFNFIYIPSLSGVRYI
jgi:hypothetical protein